MTQHTRAAEETTDAVLLSRDRTSSPYRCIAVDDLDALAPHAKAWTQLASSSAPELPVFGYEWVRTFLAHRLSLRERWRCVFAYRGDTLVGILPLIVVPHSLLGMGAPTLRTPTDLHTLMGGPILAPGGEVVAAADALIREHLHLEPRAVRITFERLIRGADYARTVNALRLKHTGLSRPSGVDGCYLDTRGEFNDHLRSLGSKTRSRLRAANRKLEALGTVTHSIVRDPEKLEQAMKRFLDLEGSGWKGREGTAILSSKRNVAFYHALREALAPTGTMQIHLLELNGHPVSGELAFRFGRKLTIHKLAYDESLNKCSPGHLLWNRTMNMAFEHPDIDTVDTLTVDAIRMRWKMTPYEYYDRDLFPPTLRATLVSKWPAALRRRMKSVLEWASPKSHDDGNNAK